MKFRKVLYQFVVASLLLALTGFPQPKTALAVPPEPEAPTAPEAVGAVDSISKPVVVFPGLYRGELDGGDPEIIPPIAGTENNQYLLGAVPDTSGAVGTTHYLQAVNKSLSLYLKDGTLIDQATFDVFWQSATTGTVCDSVNGPSHHGQPYVVFDHRAGRWVVVDIAYLDIDTGPYYLCMAVSSGTAAPVVTSIGTYLNNNAAINWYYYSVLVLGPANENFYPDEIKMGMWSDGYYLSANLFDVQNDGTWWNPEGAIAIAVNRARAIGGVSNNNLRPILAPIYEGLGYNNLVPTHLLGDPPMNYTPNYYAAIAPGRLFMWKFTVNWTNNTFVFGQGSGHTPDITVNTDTMNFFHERNVIPEPAVSEEVDSMGHRLTSPLQYREVNGIPSLWFSQTLYNGYTTGLRWYEMQFANDGTPYFYQSGTYQPPDGNFRWLPSLAVDRAGNMAIAYNMGNGVWPYNPLSTIFPSIFYTGRLRDDPAGMLLQGENILDLPGVPYPYNGSQYDPDFEPDGPWGRNSQMTVDPTDNCVFWFTSMYYHDPDGDPYLNGPGDGFTWYTRIGAFTFSECRAGQIKRISLHTNNTEGHGPSGLIDEILESYSVATSADGRYVVFPSDAPDLIDTDTNGWRDIFLRDRDTDVDGLYDEPGGVRTSRIPIHFAYGTEPNGDSFEVSMSYNGRYVVFSSLASNLVASDTNGSKDVFLYDRDYDGNGIFDEAWVGATNTRRISVASGGLQGGGESKHPFISGTGNKIAFASNSILDNLPVDNNGSFDIFIYDRDTDNNGILDEPGTITTERVSLQDIDFGGLEAPGDSLQPTLSADGHFLAFSSYANLAPQNGADAAYNPFLPKESQLTLQDVYLRDLWHHHNVLVSTVTAGGPLNTDRSYTPYISGNGQYVVFASEVALDPVIDINVYADIYRATNPMFFSTRLLFNYVLANMLVVPISVNYAQKIGDSNSYSPSINFSGTQITYASDARNLDPFLKDRSGYRDIFLYDTTSAVGGMGTYGSTQRISLNYRLGDPSNSSFVPIIAADGRHVIFVSKAYDLVEKDRNGVYDVFAYDGVRFLPVFLRIIGNATPVSLNDTVWVDVLFNDNGYEIDSMAFSIDYDETCLLYQTYSADPVPGFMPPGVSFNALDTDGEIDVSIISWPTHAAMPDDQIVISIQFLVLPSCNTWDGLLNAARVAFSRDPIPTFGSYGQSVRGITVNGFVRIGEGLRGDCNGNGSLEAGDLEAVVLEIFDGDGDLPENTPYGSFPGNPTGCNPNADNTVDAGDLSCTVDVIFNGPAAGCLSGVLAPEPSIEAPLALDAGVTLSFPAVTQSSYGSTVYVPLLLNTGGLPVNSMTFSVDIDNHWLTFDPTDADGNGMPDAITWNLPSNFSYNVTYNPLDSDGELDFVIFNFSTSGTTMPSGLLLSMALKTTTTSVPLNAFLASSSEPEASFGSISGASLIGSMVDGTLLIQPIKYIFLPLMKK